MASLKQGILHTQSINSTELNFMLYFLGQDDVIGGSQNDGNCLCAFPVLLHLMCLMTPLFRFQDVASDFDVLDLPSSTPCCYHLGLQVGCSCVSHCTQCIFSCVCKLYFVIAYSL